MKKLLFVVNVDWFFISHRLPIALAAIKKGYEVHLTCLITDKQKLLEDHGIIVHPLTLSRSGIGIFHELKTVKSLFTIISNVDPDITHCITIKPVLYGNVIAKILKVPARVSSISGLGYVFIAKGIKAKILRGFISLWYKFSLKGSKVVIFQNTADRDLLRNFGAVIPQQEILIRGSGVDLNKYEVIPEPQGDLVVMLVARLLIDKGVNEFASAANIIRSERSDVRMVIIGDVDPENPKSISQIQIERWVDDGIIEYWGYSQNVSNSIAKSNIMVLPSYREGLPKSLIEAAACGRAVVTTDVPGCRDAIIPNRTGLLVPVKSSELLADAILKLVNNKLMRDELAINGRELAESDFDIEDVVNTHLDIYRNL
ncbi:glycosyltransferase family 4 protein [Vibrio splendidus]